jgi:serine protease AprX
MTSTVAGGNGYLSGGFYRGLACDSKVVLIQAANEDGRITDASIFRALRWLQDHAREFGVRVVSLSVAGDEPAHRSPIDLIVSALFNEGVTVIAAAGNDGIRKLVPPATAVDAITVGGIDDKNSFNRDEIELWHSNYGDSFGLKKPEVVAPGIWVVAPLLPDTEEAERAAGLFESAEAGDDEAAAEIMERNLVTPAYKTVEGTSFAAPIVASVVCCMLEANPSLTPARVRELLIESAIPVTGAPEERQGAGVVDAGEAVRLALNADDRIPSSPSPF